jgi:putative colanic acid biosynthesis acetyltransferase WcaF
MPQTRVVPLASAPGKRESWKRPRAVIYLWAIAELLFVTNSWQVSSALRVRVLRLFGANIEEGVVMRPRVRVKFPWNLSIGADSWIGEGVWFHNQDRIAVGSNVVISQESFLTTGSHAHRKDMSLITRPIVINDGAWITSRCIVLGGSVLGRSCLLKPGTVVSGTVPDGKIFGTADARVLGDRF